MRRLQLTVEFAYKSNLIGIDPDKEAIDWLINEILYDDSLTLHSSKIGDEIGTVKVIKSELVIPRNS